MHFIWPKVSGWHMIKNSVHIFIPQIVFFFLSYFWCCKKKKKSLFLFCSFVLLPLKNIWGKSAPCCTGCSVGGQMFRSILRAEEMLENQISKWDNVNRDVIPGGYPLLLLTSLLVLRGIHPLIDIFVSFVISLVFVSDFTLFHEWKELVFYLFLYCVCQLSAYVLTLNHIYIYVRYFCFFLVVISRYCCYKYINEIEPLFSK